MIKSKKKEIYRNYYSSDEEDTEIININVSDEINNFMELLNTENEIPQYIKDKMHYNLKCTVKNIIIKKMGYKCSGKFHADKRLIELNMDFLEDKKIVKQVLLHELMHGAFTTINKNELVLKQGFANSSNTIGCGLNEGATEYFTQKLYQKMPNFNYKKIYIELVNIVKDMVNLYGEEVIIDAIINQPHKLKKSMEKDGKNYYDFVDIIDEYYRYVYADTWLLYSEKIGREKAKEMYLKIGKFIEEIKNKRKINDFNYIDTPSEWKSSMLVFNKNSNKRVKNFFFNFKNIIFNKKEEPLIEISLVKSKCVEKNKTFREKIKIDEKFPINKFNNKKRNVDSFER